MKTRRDRRSGFTLLELLMVVIIIAILASIALPQYIKASEKARASEALSALGAIRAAEQRFAAEQPANLFATTYPQLDIEIGTAGNGDLNDWTLVAPFSTAGTAPDVGFVSYTRTAGQYTGQVLGIELRSGAICGTFVPVNPPAGACTNG